MDVEAMRASGEFLRLSDGHRIWYRFVPGFGPAAVLIHGVGGSSLPMRRFAEPFEAAERPTLVVDLRGHGFSDSPVPGTGSTLDEHASDMLAVLDACGITKADIIGHCFGGMIAVRLARLRPALARRIVLVGSSLRPRDGLRADLSWGAIGVLGTVFESFAPRAYAARLQEQHDASVFPRVDDVYLPRMRQDFRRTSFRNAVDTMMAMSHEDLEAEASSLEAPVLVVHGGRDVYVPWANAKGSADKIPGARFELRPDDGHVSCVLAPDTTLPRDVYAFCA